VDRIIAVANNHVVTWSDLDEQMRFEALENARPLKDLTEAERHQAFEHLVQDWILRDQMQGTPAATSGAVYARIAEVRAGWRLGKDDARWSDTLRSYGLTEGEVRRLVANQIDVLRFMELRMRPLARVTRQEIEDYYTSTLVPQVKAKGQTPEPEAQVAGQIRALLAEQKMNEEMDKWLQTLRAQSNVQVLWDGVR
jgi:hypothetical protein